jgi:hypothetical protein
MTPPGIHQQSTSTTKNPPTRTLTSRPRPATHPHPSTVNDTATPTELTCNDMLQQDPPDTPCTTRTPPNPDNQPERHTPNQTKINNTKKYTAYTPESWRCL